MERQPGEKHGRYSARSGYKLAIGIHGGVGNGGISFHLHKIWQQYLGIHLGIVSSTKSKKLLLAMCKQLLSYKSEPGTERLYSRWNVPDSCSKMRGSKRREELKLIEFKAELHRPLRLLIASRPNLMPHLWKKLKRPWSVKIMKEAVRFVSNHGLQRVIFESGSSKVIANAIHNEKTLYESLRL
ncbi:conserved hypothetical protein [Ricinus communis]|uniref:Uncharacterized protein n=1 Tax=Ricinus communis TaxID=3988 RepID=B9RWA9_RICCO|nr:conserved hypothetical protein [Ricinus communis]